MTRSVDIATPAAAVWGLLEDVRRLPEFSSATIAVEAAPERITAVGQTYVQVGRILGKRYSSTWRVVALEPGRTISSEGSLGYGVGYRLTQELEPLSDDSCRLSILIDYSVPGGVLGRLAAKAGVEQQAGREAQAVLEGIKRVAESAPRPTGRRSGQPSPQPSG